MSAISDWRVAADDGIALAGSQAGANHRHAVVLLHGGGQTRHAWQSAVQIFSENGYHALAVDLRGHGDSGWSPDGRYTLEKLDHDLLTVLRSLDKPCVVVGASMGGQVALHTLAHHAPPQIRAVALVDIVPNPARDGIQRITDFMRRHLDGFPTLSDAADAVAAYNGDRARPPVIDGLRKNLRRRDDGRWYWHWDPQILTLGGSGEQLDRFMREIFDASTKIRLPCLLVRGMRSDVVDDAGVNALRETMPTLQVHEVGGAGHMVAGDRNDRFNEGVLTFMQQHLPAAS